MNRLFELHGKLAELLKDPIGNQAALGGLQVEIARELETAKTGYAETTKMMAEMKQLRVDLDRQAEAVRRFEKMGLSIARDGRVGPRGLHERREMIADGRGFLDDETAKRFCAYIVDCRLRLAGRSEIIPTYIREIADDVRKQQASMVGKAGLEPGTDASGGYLIADEFRPEIVRNVEAEGVLFPLCRRIPMAGMGTVNIPKRSAGLTAYWIAAATAPTESRPTLGILQLTPEKLGSLVYVPNEFIRGSLLIDLGNFIALEMTHAFALALDDALVNGDGTATSGGITGILQSTTISAVAAAAGHTGYATFTGTDVSNWIGGLAKSYALGTAKWGMSLSMMLCLRALKDTNGNPLYQRGGDGIPTTIDDFPFVITPRCPAKAAVTTGVHWGWFGDLNKSHVVGMVRELEIASSEHAAFPTDQTLTRGILHVDMGEQDATAISVCEAA